MVLRIVDEPPAAIRRRARADATQPRRPHQASRGAADFPEDTVEVVLGAGDPLQPAFVRHEAAVRIRGSEAVANRRQHGRRRMAIVLDGQRQRVERLAEFLRACQYLRRPAGGDDAPRRSAARRPRPTPDAADGPSPPARHRKPAARRAHRSGVRSACSRRRARDRRPPTRREGRPACRAVAPTARRQNALIWPLTDCNVNRLACNHQKCFD